MTEWANGYRYPDPIHIPTFTAAVYTTFRLGAVVTALDTGEIRTVGPLGWITYVGSFAGGPNVAQPAGFAPGTSYFTLGVAADVVTVPDTILPGVPTISLGGAASVDYGGFISVVEANFVAAGTAVAGITAVTVNNTIVNAVRVKDAATNEGVETPTGEEVFGLLQAWDDVTTVDGVAVAANPAENLQISFVYWSKVPGPAPAPALTAYSLPIGTYYFAGNTNELDASKSFAALLGDSSPLPDYITRVYYVDTFTGVSYTSYPVGALVVALDLGVMREVSPNGWIIRRREYAEPLVATQTIYVRDTGDDDTGDGEVGTPYATLARAMLDVPMYHSGTNIFGYVIDWDSAGGTLDFGTGIEYRGGWPRLNIQGPDLVADAGIFTSGVGTAAINVATVDTRPGGRQLTFAGGDIPTGTWTAHEHKGKRIALTSGAESGAVGWIYDNDTTSLFVELDTNNFGTLGADDVLVTDFPANLVITAGVAEVLGSVAFINCDIDVQGALNMQQMFVQLAVTRIRLSNDAGTFLNMVDAGSCLADSVYLWNQASAQRNMMLGTRGAKFIFNSGPSVIDGWGGGAARAINMNSWDMDLHFDQEVVFADVDQVYVGCPTITSGVANDGRFIRLHGCGHLFEQLATVEVGEANVFLPAVFGTITDNYVLGLQAVANQGPQHWEFMEAPVVTTALPGTNNCSIGGAEAYFDQDVEIWGTGNGEKLLATVHAWNGGPPAALGPPPGLIGYLMSMDFAAPPAGESIVGDFVLPAEYLPGQILQLEFDYSTNLFAGNSGDFDFNTALFRPGTDDDVNPPANLETLAGQALPESAAAQELILSPRIDMTDGAGDIDSIAPSIGDKVAVNVLRNNAGASLSIFSIYTNFRVWMTGL